MLKPFSSRLPTTQFDVAIIGGGINGAVSAAALSSQGLSVLLVDKEDFAAGCSSNSSNLAWGGIKYLESHEYTLVNKLCRSRNHLMRNFPSSIKEIRFLTTIQKGFRFHPLFIFMGSLVYWVFGRFFTQAPQYLSKAKLKQIDSRIDNRHATGGIEYSDAFLIDNDSRFVFHFIRKAIDYGATAENYCRVDRFQNAGDHWKIELCDLIENTSGTVHAKAIINASGPWVDGLNERAQIETQHRHLFSKGVHLIIDRKPAEQRVLAFFASDGRLFFVLPMGDKTCIGTTDTPVDTIEKKPSEDDIAFILSNANELLDLSLPLNESDVITFRCGVRPLAVKKGQSTGDWLQISRKHHIDVDLSEKFASIFGGKLTDCVNVGEEIQRLAKDMGLVAELRSEQWYGEPGDSEKHLFFQKVRQYWKAETHILESIWRRWSCYADELLVLLKSVEMREVLIPEIDMIRAEIFMSKKYEKVKTLEDFFRRRHVVALVVKHQDLRARASTKEIAEILFSDDAEQKLNEFI